MRTHAYVYDRALNVYRIMFQDEFDYEPDGWYVDPGFGMMTLEAAKTTVSALNRSERAANTDW